MDWTRTYIIGGGPSAGPVETARLDGVVLAVNDAVFHKFSHAWFSLDHNYAARVATQFGTYTGERHVCLMDKAWHKPDYDTMQKWRRVYTETPSLRPGVLSSGSPMAGCSGLVALNLAAQMGATTIVLFGYDFELDYRYFFEGQASHRRERADAVLRAFDAVAPWYAAQGITVYNANPQSRITAFPVVQLEAAV